MTSSLVRLVISSLVVPRPPLAPRCAVPTCSARSSVEPRPPPPLALRTLDQQEVLDKLNAVPVFGIVNAAEELVADRDEEGAMVCRFYLEISEAQAALTALRDINPGVAMDLTVVPLGTAFALSEWQVGSARACGPARGAFAARSSHPGVRPARRRRSSTRRARTGSFRTVTTS